MPIDSTSMTEFDITGFITSALDAKTAGVDKNKRDDSNVIAEKESKYNIERELPVDIDDINTGDMLMLISGEIAQKGIAGHHIDSINNFYRIGIKQIVTDVFKVEKADSRICEIKLKKIARSLTLRSM